MATHTALITLATSVAWLLAFAGDIVLLLVIATVVRRHRPDAYKPLLGWAIAVLGLTLFRSLFMAIVRVVVAREGGVETMLTVQSVEILLGAFVGAGLVGLLAHGLVRLAQPPRPEALPQMPPYR